MCKVVIWGAGGLGRVVYDNVKDSTDVLFFVDSNPENCYPPPTGLKIERPSLLKETEFDIIYIASLAAVDAIYSQLTDSFQVDTDKIDRSYSTADAVSKFILSPRVRFLEQFSSYVYSKKIVGNVAEVGVLRGDFAKVMNRVFPDRELYLFDTFEGFSERDFACESTISERYDQMLQMRKTFGNAAATSIDIVMEKMIHPEMCVIKKGFFPDTFDIENEQFSFVNIDTDLYQPTAAGLEIFYPLMASNGVILVHDYFAGATLGVRKAVDEFLATNNVPAIPIGDYSSIAISKTCDAAHLLG